jgi:hypothetical protein
VAIYTKITFCGKNTRNNLQLNYFSHLTLLCDVFAKDATPVYVASVGTAAHIIGWQARAATYDTMCGVLVEGATQKGVAPLRREPHHKRIRSVK